MSCLLYARVSTDKQAQKDLSIPAQIAAMKEYARRNDWQIAGHFVDEGESARTANRPELKNLLQYCKEHKEIDAVIVHKLDRMARNLVDYGTIKAILKQRGIRLISISERFEDNAVGDLMENIFASISEFYSANLGEEIKKANKIKLEKGEWPHKPPIGYKSIRGQDNRPEHVPDPDKVSLVRQAFELFSTGSYSLWTLSEEMCARGLKTKSGKMRSPEQMKKLLMRKFYLGQLEWQGKLYRGKHEPIISAELFYRVQEILKHRSVDCGEKGRLHFLLRGTVYCHVCGQRLTGEVHPRGSYYRCIPDHHGSKCDQPYIPVETLDGQLEALYANLQPPKKVLQMLKREMDMIARKRTGAAKREIERARKTLEDLESKELKLLDEMLSGKLDRRIYERLQIKYTEQKGQAEARLAQMEVDYKDPLDFLDKCITVASMLLPLHQRFDYGERKSLLRAVFEKIYVEDKKIVAVEFTPPFKVLLGEDLRRSFKDHPSEATKEDVFEHILEAVSYGRNTPVIGAIQLLLDRASSTPGMMHHRRRSTRQLVEVH